MNNKSNSCKRIVIYGVGNNWSIFSKMADLSKYDFTAMVDSNRVGESINGRLISSPDELKRIDYDEIYVLPWKYDEIVGDLVNRIGICKEKIHCADEINKSDILSKASYHRFIMITTDVPFLNYPYDGLCHRDDFCYLWPMGQKESFVFEPIYEEVDLEKKYFIVRDHCYQKFKRNGFLAYLKEKYPNSKWIVILSDMCEGEFGRLNVKGEGYIDDLKSNFDLIITYHSGDADKYGLTHYEQVYPSNPLRKMTEKNDVLFVGKAKNRLELLYDTCRILEENEIKYKFYISEIDESKKIDNSNIIFNKQIEYEEYLREVQNTKCILEICQQGNESTYRYAEAVINNKRLLFNDKSILGRKYYNENFMHYFDMPNNIDINWLKHDVQVNYQYRNDYEPDRILSFIEKALS